MSTLSTTFPDADTPEPSFDYQHFNADVDAVGEWRLRNIPWRKVEISRLYKREEFLPGSGYGRNAWGELYKGESVIRLYVRLPETLVSQYNVLVEYHSASMVILKDAQPEFVKPRKMSEPMLIHYYRWAGVW